MDDLVARYDGSIGALHLNGKKVGVLLLEAHRWVITEGILLWRRRREETRLMWFVVFSTPQSFPDEGTYADPAEFAELDRSIFVYQGYECSIEWLAGEEAEAVRKEVTD